MRFQTNSTYEKYKKSVEHANELVARNSEQYKAVMESMVKAEELRAAFTKDVIQKYAKVIEQLAKEVLEGAQSVLKSAEKVDPKEDIKRLVEENGRDQANRVFDFVRCEKFDAE